MMKYLVNKTVLIISPEPWDHLAVSKHHYARTLLSNNNRVYFLNPPAQLNRLRNAEEDNNVRVIDYSSYRGINKMPSFIRDQINLRLINRIKKLCATDFDVVWSFDSFRFQNLDLWKTRRKIYHVVDVHIAPLEQQLLNTADIILSVSQMIHDRAAPYNKVKEKINHGLAPWFLTNAQPLQHDVQSLIRENGRQRAGYVGNLDNWCLDDETLLRIVRENSKTDFYFIGPYKDDSRLARKLSGLENAILAGRVEPERLPAWFQHMHLFLMCYDGANKAVNSNHHKILEFLSTGKPAVINYTDEYKDKRHLVIMANANDELPGLFQKVSRDLPTYYEAELVASRKEYAALNSYQSQLEKIDLLLESMII